MRRLLIPARSAIASMRAPPKPSAENSLMAARRMVCCVRSASRVRSSTGGTRATDMASHNSPVGELRHRGQPGVIAAGPRARLRHTDSNQERDPMTRTVTPRPAGHALVEALIEQGVDTAFGVPGESFLAALD